MLSLSREQGRLGFGGLEAYRIIVGSPQASGRAPLKLVDSVVEVGTLHNPSNVNDGRNAAVALDLAFDRRVDVHDVHGEEYWRDWRTLRG